jgi:hypothetical protein
MDLDATDVFGQADRAHEDIFKLRSWESNTHAGETSSPFRASEALMAPEDVAIPQPSEVEDKRQSSESSTSKETTSIAAHDVPDANSDSVMLRAGGVATQQDNASVESDSDVVVVQSDVTLRLSKKIIETEIWRGPVPEGNVEIRLSQLPRTKCHAFEEVQNDIIEDIMREMTSRSGRKYYEVKFTDGRKETVSCFVQSFSSRQQFLCSSRDPCFGRPLSALFSAIVLLQAGQYGNLLWWFRCFHCYSTSATF